MFTLPKIEKKEEINIAPLKITKNIHLNSGPLKIIPSSVRFVRFQYAWRYDSLTNAKIIRESGDEFVKVVTRLRTIVRASPLR